MTGLKTFLTAAVFVVAGGASAHAAEITYTGPRGGDWALDANWSSQSYPTSNDYAVLNNLAVLDSSMSDDNMLAVRVGQGTAENGMLEVESGGHLKATANSSWGSYLGVDAGSSGTINQSGGTTEINYMEVGRGGTGLWSVTGGEAIVARGRGGHSLYLGTDDTQAVGGGDGTFEISGGLLKTRTGVCLGSADGTGVGTFSVLGSGASRIGIGSQSNGDGAWTQHAGSVLRVGVDVHGTTKITVDDAEGGDGTFVVFENGALLDVDYYDGGHGGGTWTIMEVENGTITDNGLAFAPGVDTATWSFAIDNSGPHAKLTITAPGEPANRYALTVGDAKNQMMRYGLDYERLWFWWKNEVNADLIARYSVTDCEIDYLRCAINCKYELTEGVYDLSAYTQKIIPMMTAMQNENPNIKWFASPRPLNEAVGGAAWQPYPIWITGAPNYNSTSFDFNDLKCADYLLRYLLLMKSYGFKITYLDVTNEWQSNVAGGRVTQSDVRDIAQAFQDYLANPWSHPDIPGLVLTDEDIPLIVAPSAWNYSQGRSWIIYLNTQAKKDAVDIASCHNTDKSGTAEDFADAVDTSCNPGTEAWQTELHGWKSTSGKDEVLTSSFLWETIRAGFTGINGWLTIGTTDQGHCYLLNNGSTVTRNVKYYIFKKLTTTSNYGRALDIDQPTELASTAALVRENALTVWLLNDDAGTKPVEVAIGSRTMAESDIRVTRWDEPLAVEGVPVTIAATDRRTFEARLEGNSLYCFEMLLDPTGSDFPFLEAENYSDMSGVVTRSCADIGGGDYVGFPGPGDEIAFDVDVTRMGSYDIGFRVASASENIQFALYDGTTVVATVDRIATGDAQNWTTLYATVPLSGGSTTLKVKALGGGWGMNWLECAAAPTGLETENLALNQPTSASSVHGTGYETSKAVDGDPGTRWASSDTRPWFEVDLGDPTQVNGVRFLDYANRTKAYDIWYFDGRWGTASSGGDPEDVQVDTFPTVTGTRFRIQFSSVTDPPSLWEFELYYTEASAPATSINVESNAAWLSWEGVPGSRYALQHAAELGGAEDFTNLESGIPGQTSGHTNAVAIPGDAAFYRVLLEE